MFVAIAETFDLQVTLQASSVVDALQLIQKIVPDIILLSLGHAAFGDMDGLVTLRKTLPVVPILALTSNEVPGQEQTALACGAQMVLTKAVSRTELIDALRKLPIIHQKQVDDKGW